MAITRFEDIRAWQYARELAKVVYGFSSEEGFNRDFALRDQIRRSAVSMMANVAEGFDSHSNGEFIQFLYYALRSASELQSHCYVAYGSKIHFEETVFYNLCRSGQRKENDFSLY